MPLDQSARIRLSGESMTLVLSEPGAIELRAFDATGRQHGPVLSVNYPAGTHVLHAPWRRTSMPLWIELRLPSGRLLRRVPLGPTTLTAGRGEGMRRIPAGTFAMGSPNDEPGRYDDEKLHQVTLGAFWIDTVETTRQAFGDLMGYLPEDSLCTVASCPVAGISWYEAILFCNARSRHRGRDSTYEYARVWRDASGRATGFDALRLRTGTDGYRLPTEAQWERAARGNTTSAWPWGSDSLDSQLHGWHLVNSGGMPHPVGRLGPDDWGLRDLTGNVSEWTWDWYGTYDTLGPTDPRGPDDGLYRTCRGGNWKSSARTLRSAFRNGAAPATRDLRFGMRCVRPSPD